MTNDEAKRVIHRLRDIQSLIECRMGEDHGGDSTRFYVRVGPLRFNSKHDMALVELGATIAAGGYTVKR
jgi:hypothetical protein